MNTGMVTSFVIGGLLLLSILALNLNVKRSATSLTMRQITQQNIQATSEILTHDFSKIGYDTLATISDPITVADSNRIVFKSNINNTGANETIEWHFDTSAPLTSTANPNDYILNRNVNGNKQDITIGISSLKLVYLDKNLKVITTPVTDPAERNKIRHLKINVVVSSEEKLGNISSDEAEYVHSSWTKVISPKNIQ